jgi:hypothetical protein
MMPLKVLHFDDERFSQSLKALIIRKISRPVDFESRIITGLADFESLKARILEMGDSEKAVHVVLLDLRLESKPSLSYYVSNGSEVFEGVEIVKLLHKIDPDARRIKRAFLTGTPNYERVRELQVDFSSYNVDVLSKEMAPTPGFQTIDEPFPKNVIDYLHLCADQLGVWGES